MPNIVHALWNNTYSRTKPPQSTAEKKLLWHDDAIGKVKNMNPVKFI